MLHAPPAVAAGSLAALGLSGCIVEDGKPLRSPAVHPCRAIREAVDQRQVRQPIEGWHERSAVDRSVGEHGGEARRRRREVGNSSLKQQVRISLAARDLDQLLEQYVAHPQEHHLMQRLVETRRGRLRINPGRDERLLELLRHLR